MRPQLTDPRRNHCRPAAHPRSRLCATLRFPYGWLLPHRFLARRHRACLVEGGFDVHLLGLVEVFHEDAYDVFWFDADGLTKIVIAAVRIGFVGIFVFAIKMATS